MSKSLLTPSNVKSSNCCQPIPMRESIAYCRKVRSALSSSLGSSFEVRGVPLYMLLRTRMVSFVMVIMVMFLLFMLRPRCSSSPEDCMCDDCLYYEWEEVSALVIVVKLLYL